MNRRGFLKRFSASFASVLGFPLLSKGQCSDEDFGLLFKRSLLSSPIKPSYGPPLGILGDIDQGFDRDKGYYGYVTVLASGLRDKVYRDRVIKKLVNSCATAIPLNFRKHVTLEIKIQEGWTTWHYNMNGELCGKLNSKGTYVNLGNL